MYLKSLTALGFKSFADKTTLTFLPGVSAIVGPNGCGKSNISDAVRWVLGEQSARALRGGEMADVIFNGTDHRKAMGMAEVSLTIGDVDAEHLTAAGLELSYNEVTLTRRVFRDGGSEYFLNKTPCRLKDVQQLFMGTGVGRTSYSIMAQGNITQILSSKPDDRRVVFEEAAGITKFKAQKREALRKLEHTDQNLLRVADLIREVKRQIGSLQRQAGKARRFKQIQTELQHLETQLARHQFDVIHSEILERTRMIEQLRAEIEEGQHQVQRGEDGLTELRSLLSALEEELRRAEQQGQELKSEIERHQSRIQVNQERRLELEAQNEKALSDIRQAEERHSVSGQELAGVSERLAAARRNIAGQRQTLETRREEVQQLERDLNAQQEALRLSQSDAFSSAQRLARLRNEINTLDLQKQGQIVRLEKLSAEKVQIEEERLRLEERLAEFAATVESDQLDVQARRGTVEDRQQRLLELQQEIDRLTLELDDAVRQQAEKRSRLTVLRQLEAEHEGFSAGALAVLKHARQALGSLSDKLRVPDEYILPIETALGHHLQLVLTEQPEAAHQILSELSAGGKGRASIASLALFDDPAPGPARAETQPPPGSPARALLDGAVPALSVVQADPSVQPLLHRLLEATWIVPDLAEATRCWQGSGGSCDFVTRTGELLSRQGVFTGGAQANGAGSAPSSILGRKNQIALIEEQMAVLEEQVNALSRAKGSLQSEQTSLQAGLHQAQTELRSQEVAIATRQGELKALENSRHTLARKIETVVFETESLSHQEQEGSAQRETLSSQAWELEQEEARLQQRLADLNGNLEQLRRQRDTAQTALTEVKVALASEEQVGAALEQQHDALQQRLEELAQLIAARRDELSSFETRRGQFAAEIEVSQRRIDSLQHDREQTNLRLADLAARKESQELEILSRDEDLKEQRRRLTALQQRQSGIEIELAQKQMALDNLRQRVREKYQLNLDDIRSECITITVVSEGPPRVETLSPEEMSSLGVATDWNAVADQVAALQKRLEEMGPVNLVAIEEYEETEQRHQFLTAQHEDLVQAKEQLLEAIQRINIQTRDMFSQTFQRIRENFRLMFTEIFGGGKADLVLVNEGDVLESGIDIVARPPGKQLQGISLLSGGEQTMTAVALLFAIYQVKPSPFCVLDELDAPLDESNINRFVRILQRFLEHSQFIIITHNKRTIAMADVLYGVTMQEHGVSTIVSVKFRKTEPGQAEQALPLVPLPSDVRPIETEEDAPHSPAETLDVVMAK